MSKSISQIDRHLEPLDATSRLVDVTSEWQVLVCAPDTETDFVEIGDVRVVEIEITRSDYRKGRHRCRSRSYGPSDPTTCGYRTSMERWSPSKTARSVDSITPRASKVAQ